MIQTFVSISVRELRTSGASFNFGGVEESVGGLDTGKDYMLGRRLLDVNLHPGFSRYLSVRTQEFRKNYLTSGDVSNDLNTSRSYASSKNILI